MQCVPAQPAANRETRSSHSSHARAHAHAHTRVLAGRRVLQGSRAAGQQGCRGAPSLGRPPKQLHPAMMRPFAPGPSIHLPACLPAIQWAIHLDDTNSQCRLLPSVDLTGSTLFP